jgi:hypothetical protein
MLPEQVELIRSLIEQTRGNSDRFAEHLRHRRIPHLSFSQVTTVEACEQRYFLQYELLLDPSPVPEYFKKGKLLHQVIATSYANVAQRRPVSPDPYFALINQHYQGETEIHLRNAVQLHLENLWQGCEVVAVEEPFVMQIEERLPPMVGVIDLILKQEDRYILIDHKTGRDFYPQDELQMAIYVEFIRHLYGGGNFQFYYEQYRWVRRLDRIRKPAFQRTEVVLPPHYWQPALSRIRGAFRKIERIKSTGQAAKNGDCYRCPYRNICRPDCRS